MKKDHLPLLGAGPAYVLVISMVTAAALALHYTGCIRCIEIPAVSRIALKTAAVLLVIIGVWLWLRAVFGSRLTRNIKDNQLLTTGVYGLVRHPVYSAFMLAEWGLLMWTCNLWFFILMAAYWIYLKTLVAKTEEKWLLERYGAGYEAYMKQVNCCIPWFRKR